MDEEQHLIAFLITTHCLFAIVGGLARWLRALRIGRRGAKRRTVVSVMLGFAWRARYRNNLLALLVVAIALGFAFFGHPVLILLPVWLALIVLGRFIRFAVPPTVVLLACSKSLSKRYALLDRNELLTLSFVGTFPYRVVYLLDRRVSPSLQWSLMATHNLRTIDDRVWVPVVHGLIDLAPVVVVDTRFVSPAVVEEVAYLFATGQETKTLFVINRDGSHPALDSSRAAGVAGRMVQLLDLGEAVRAAINQAETAAGVPPTPMPIT